MNSKEQSKLFSNVVNIGASFGHGCTSCTINPVFRQSNEESGDHSWVRRNYLVQLINNYEWKDKSLFQYEFLSIVENDSRDNFATIFQDRSLKKSPYRSRWLYNPRSDFTQEMSYETEMKILNDPLFHDHSEIIGGAYIRKKEKFIKLKKRKMTGHLYQTYPGKYLASGSQSRSIYDMGTDSATIETFFINYAGKKLVKKLKKSKWKDSKLRNEAKSIIMQKIRNMNPSLISTIDPLFWDSIPRMLYYANKRNPKSFMIKFLTSKMFRKFAKIKLHSIEFENRKFDDFFEILSKVSFNTKTKKAIPVIMANLINKPGKHISDNGLEETFGTLIGNYVFVSTGIDFTKEFIKWLKHLEYENRNQKSKAVSYYSKLKKLSLKELGVTPEELLETDYIIGKIGDRMRGKLFKIILKAFGDLPLMIKSLDEAFTFLNSKIKKFTARQDHNVYLVDAIDFYKNFHLLVHPKTMHPTVNGAKFIAKMFTEAPCKLQVEK